MIGELFKFARNTGPYMKEKSISKETIKMLEIIVFGITLVVSNVVAALVVLKVVTSPKVLKKYMDTVADMSVEMTKKMYHDLEKELD